MRGRFAALAAGLVAGIISAAACSPAQSGELNPEEARGFVADKLFSYTCVDGTNGAGRIYPDGSVIGTIQVGSGPFRHVSLPPGTIRLTSESICASMRGTLVQPCFNVVQTSPLSFRGSIRGLDSAYCDFMRRSPRLEITERAESRSRAHQIHAPLSLLPSGY